MKKIASDNPLFYSKKEKASPEAICKGDGKDFEAQSLNPNVSLINIPVDQRVLPEEKKNDTETQNAFQTEAKIQADSCDKTEETPKAETGHVKDVDNKGSRSRGAPPVLFVGIDLGTSRTSVVSSNGHKFTESTYVGKPKDAVSEKLFGKRLLFGDEAVNNRLSVDLYRPLEKGVIQSSPKKKQDNVNAVQALLKHIISLIKSSEDTLVYGVVGAPSTASIKDKKILVDSVRGVLDAVMVVSEPFCVAYGMDMLTDALIVDIGAGTMDLCRMHGALPSREDQTTVKKAGDFIDRKLFSLINEKYPEAQFTIHMIKIIKEKFGFVSEKEEKVNVEFTVAGRPIMFDITNELKNACLEIVPELQEAIQKLIGSFDPEFQQRLRNSVVGCGGGSQLVGLRRLIKQALEELGGGNVEIIDEPIFAGANGALKIANEMPDSFWEHLKN